MDTFVSLQGAENTIAIVFLVANESRNEAIICSASASSIMLMDASGVKADAGLPIFWFCKRVPNTC